MDSKIQSSLSNSNPRGGQVRTKGISSLRIDNCDERRIYKSEDISRPKGGTFTFNTSPKSSDFCLSNDIW